MEQLFHAYLPATMLMAFIGGYLIACHSTRTRIRVQLSKLTSDARSA